MEQHNTVTMIYPDENYCCVIKHCQHKKRNGRCSLTRITFGYGPGGTNFADCRDYLLQASIAAEEPIHEFFSLSYASYLVLPRSVLQSMPLEWQTKFVKMLGQVEERFGDVPPEGTYYVQLKDAHGHFLHDPLMDYERGRRRIEPIPCPLCGRPTVDGNPHSSCVTREQYLADKQAEQAEGNNG